MKPLHGVRIVSVEQFGAGPYATMFLADLGAEVIKVENAAIGGDPARKTGPYMLGENDSEYFQVFNINKKSVALDLRHDDGKAALMRLIAGADAVMNNLRGDLPAKLGLDYAALSAIKPAIVCVHLSAYGRDNERAAWPGYDYLMQAEAGYLSLTGEPDGPPARFGLSVVDQMTGLYAAFALLAGVVAARAGGEGRDIDVSLFDAALQNLTYLAVWYLNGGVNQGRGPRSAHPSLTPSQLYRTRDGFIFIMCNKEKFWPVLCDSIGRPDWRDQPEYRDFKARLAHRGRLTEALDAVLSERTTAEWLATFAGKVPAAPVYDVAGALDSAYVRASASVRTAPHPAGDIRLLASPVRCPGEETPCRAAPALGADTDGVLTSLGFAPSELALLRRDGVI